MSLNEWLLVMLACTAGAVSPGPSLLLVLRHALVSSRAGLVCSWAHACGVALYASAAITGLALLIAASPFLMQLIWLVSSVWLSFLALQSWRAPDQVLMPKAAIGTAARDGLFMALANPKVMLFFVALFSAAVPAQVSEAGRVQAVGTAFVVDGLWYSAISLGLRHQTLKNVLQNKQRLLNRFSACILWLFAAAALGRVWVERIHG